MIDSTSEADSETTAGSAAMETADVEEVLVDEGLLARWFLDDAAAGTIPAQADDAAEEPFHLPIDFTGRVLAWTEEASQRGLRWTAAGDDGGPLRPITGSKFDMLEGRGAATLELVASVDAVTNKESRLFHLGSGEDRGDFTLSSGDDQELQFVLNGQIVAVWPVDLPVLGRAVFHVVVDTSRPDPNARVSLFVNGGPVEPLSTTPPELDAGIRLSSSPYLSLGNRNRERSIEGAVFYAALYAMPLHEGAIEHNATLLFQNDDGR
jgi:hypothetical protein